MSTWLFANVPFVWLRQDGNGTPTQATWRRRPRIVIRPLLGTGDADITTIGYEPWSITGPVFIAAADGLNFVARNGEPATLTDGTETWTAVLDLDLSRLAMSDEGWTGTATFTRARA